MIPIAAPPHPLPPFPNLDLNHVELIQEDRDGTAVHCSQNAPAGAAIPPIPPTLAEKIESSAFVEMGDLLPNHIGLDEATKAKQKH